MGADPAERASSCRPFLGFFLGLVRGASGSPRDWQVRRRVASRSPVHLRIADGIVNAHAEDLGPGGVGHPFNHTKGLDQN